MECKINQLLIILSADMKQECYGNIRNFTSQYIEIGLKTNEDLKVGSELLCLAVDEPDVIEFYSKVIGSKNNTIQILQPIDAKTKKYEKRKFNRIDVSLGFSGICDRIVNSNINIYGKAFNGTVKNISSGGVMMICNLNLPVGLIFRFRLEMGSGMDCAAIIVRTENINNTGLYRYGCEFLNMNIENVKRISLFTFKQHMQILRQHMKDND